MKLDSTIIEVRQDAVADISYDSFTPHGDGWVYAASDGISLYKFQRRLPVPERVECPSTFTQ